MDIFRVPQDAPPKWLFMITAYLDESGQEFNDGRMVVAGFAGNEDQWNAFLPEWKHAIAPRKNLHLKDLRFKKDRDRSLLERAGILPEKHRLMPLFGSVRVSDYADLVVGTEDEFVFPGYIACLHPLVINTLRGIPAAERLEIVLEQQDRYRRLADLSMYFFSEMANIPEFRMPDGKPKLAKWSWVPKESTSLTEPADYLAFALLQAYRDANSRKAKWCAPIVPSDGEAYGKALSALEARRVVMRAQEMHRSQGLWK